MLNLKKCAKGISKGIPPPCQARRAKASTALLFSYLKSNSKALFILILQQKYAILTVRKTEVLRSGNSRVKIFFNGGQGRKHHQSGQFAAPNPAHVVQAIDAAGRRAGLEQKQGRTVMLFI